MNLSEFREVVHGKVRTIDDWNHEEFKNRLVPAGYTQGGSEVANAILTILERNGESEALVGVVRYMVDHGIEPLTIDDRFLRLISDSCGATGIAQ